MILSWRSRKTHALLWAAGFSLCAGAVPAEAQPSCPAVNPYVFILLDTSGSMNLAPPCTQADFDAGLCPLVCAASECRAPLQGDDPSSKLFLVKSALTEALESPEAENIQLGFASFNQDALYARAKHWLYEATANGPSIPGAGPFPALGSREVLGRLWSCDNGTGDSEAGCTTAVPADLTDSWEVARVRHLAKGGQPLTQTVSVFVRQSGLVYRVQYIPFSGTLGGAVQLRIRIERCLNSACSSRQFTGESVVPFTPVGEYLVWDNLISRTEPVGFYTQSASADSNAGNTCAGWDPNTDTTADRFSGYSLRWPTVTGDPRGSLFLLGDVIPLDWQTDQRQLILGRLAPNRAVNPAAEPDFRTAPYLRDFLQGAEAFLRLKSESSRPLIAVGSTPQGATLVSFRNWYTGCAAGGCSTGWADLAAFQDPEWSCRQVNLVLITDGEDTCGIDPCAEAAALYAQGNVRIHVVAFGIEPGTATTLECAAASGGTGGPAYPRHRDELVQALRDIFAAAGQP